jgi:hypothetical protein
MSKVEDMSVWEFNWVVPMGVRSAKHSLHSQSRLLRITKIKKLLKGRND